MTTRTAGRMEVDSYDINGHGIQSATITINYHSDKEDKMRLSYEDLVDLEYLLNRALGRIK